MAEVKLTKKQIEMIQCLRDHKEVWAWALKTRVWKTLIKRGLARIDLNQNITLTAAGKKIKI